MFRQEQCPHKDCIVLRYWSASLVQEDTNALISAAAAAAAQQQQELAADQQQSQQPQPQVPEMGPTAVQSAAAWQDDDSSEETESGLPEGIVLVSLC